MYIFLAIPFGCHQVFLRNMERNNLFRRRLPFTNSDYPVLVYFNINIISNSGLVKCQNVSVMPIVPYIVAGRKVIL